MKDGIVLVENIEILRARDELWFYSPVFPLRRFIKSIDIDGGITLDHDLRLEPEVVDKWIKSGKLFLNESRRELTKQLMEYVEEFHARRKEREKQEEKE